jgi:hypothetical protein
MSKSYTILAIYQPLNHSKLDLEAVYEMLMTPFWA